jgi:transglutaminase-like putative cysteine protease
MMNLFLEPSEYIDFNHPAIRAQAEALANGGSSEEEVARSCFEFVHDAIRHSGDFQMNPVTCRASDVLLHKTGYCYAKSHLLAALLRANGIPAGLCYQRLSVGSGGAPYCLHGLNAVYLRRHGWYRIDARGNKPGVSANFTPPIEQLAFAILEPQEGDLPEIWPAPLPIIVRSLLTYRTVEELGRNLPDVELLPLNAA